MRKIKNVLVVLTFLLTILALTTMINSKNANATTLEDLSYVYNAPTTTPNGKMYEVLDNVDFSAGSHDWIENDDWDWDTLALDYRLTQEADPMMAITPLGGTFHPSFEVWVPGINLNGVTGFMYYVDFTNLFDPTNIRMYMRFGSSTDHLTGNIGELNMRYLNAFESFYYYDFNSGSWQETISQADAFFNLPDYFKGYVYIPIKNYNDVHIDGVGINNIFLQLYHLDFCSGNNTENVTPIYLDDIMILKETSEHNHDFVFKGTVEKTCNQKGLDLYQCACGQVQWKNVVDKANHIIDKKYYCSQGLASALCEVCQTLVYFEEDVVDLWPDAITISYHYNHEGYETKEYQYPKGYMLGPNDIPWICMIEEGYDHYQFFRFTIDAEGLYGKNPLGMIVTENLELYGQYNSLYADQKYQAMVSDVSFNGGPYDEETYKEQIIFVGQSNFSLWHGMENWYANRGLPVRNNSLAGATSHNYVEFVEELVLIYKPKIVVCIVSSNDLAYHQMSDKTIMNNMISFYEAIDKHLPETEVIFVSGNPLPGRNEYFGAIKRLNSKLEAFCNSNDNTHYVGIYDITMEYVKQYPVGWDTWTHLHQEELSYVMGDEIYKVMIEVIRSKNIIFK